MTCQSTLPNTATNRAVTAGSEGCGWSWKQNRTIRVTVLSILAASLVTQTAAAADQQAYHPRVGEKHVNFTLPAIDDGRPLSLEQLRGSKVLLIQFASW